MPVVRYGQPLNVMVAAKGHPYQRDPFMAMFDDLPGVACTLVEQPLAARLMNPDGMKGFDALVLYDMPGLDFGAADRPAYVEPDEAFKAGFLALLDRGLASSPCTMRLRAGRPGPNTPNSSAAGFSTSRGRCSGASGPIPAIGTTSCTRSNSPIPAIPSCPACRRASR